MSSSRSAAARFRRDGRSPSSTCSAARAAVTGILPGKSNAARTYHRSSLTLVAVWGLAPSRNFRSPRGDNPISRATWRCDVAVAREATALRRTPRGTAWLCTAVAPLGYGTYSALRTLGTFPESTPGTLRQTTSDRQGPRSRARRGSRGPERPTRAYRHREESGDACRLPALALSA